MHILPINWKNFVIFTQNIFNMTKNVVWILSRVQVLPLTRSICWLTPTSSVGEVTVLGFIRNVFYSTVLHLNENSTREFIGGKIVTWPLISFVSVLVTPRNSLSEKFSLGLLIEKIVKLLLSLFLPSVLLSVLPSPSLARPPFKTNRFYKGIKKLFRRSKYRYIVSIIFRSYLPSIK